MSTYTKMSRGGFVRGDFVLHSHNTPYLKDQLSNYSNKGVNLEQ